MTPMTCWSALLTGLYRDYSLRLFHFLLQCDVKGMVAFKQPMCRWYRKNSADTDLVEHRGSLLITRSVSELQIDASDLERSLKPKSLYHLSLTGGASPLMQGKTIPYLVSLGALNSLAERYMYMYISLVWLSRTFLTEGVKHGMFLQMFMFTIPHLLSGHTEHTKLMPF